MERFILLFRDLLVFVYHCFDRVVIHGYLSGLSRPEQIVHFVHQVVGGWTAKQTHHAVLAAFQLSAKAYGLNELRYDLRKLKGHGLLQRDGRRYAYRLTTKGAGRASILVLPQASLRPSRQQLLPPPARS